MSCCKGTLLASFEFTPGPAIQERSCKHFQIACVKHLIYYYSLDDRGFGIGSTRLGCIQHHPNTDAFITNIYTKEKNQQLFPGQVPITIKLYSQCLTVRTKNDETIYPVSTIIRRLCHYAPRAIASFDCRFGYGSPKHYQTIRIAVASNTVNIDYTDNLIASVCRDNNSWYIYSPITRYDINTPNEITYHTKLNATDIFPLPTFKTVRYILFPNYLIIVGINPNAKTETETEPFIRIYQTKIPQTKPPQIESMDSYNLDRITY
jgi:hypothetical protein